MIVTLLGVRGSRPVSISENLRYGGNTTAFKIDVHGMPPIYVDGGTGLHEEGVRLVRDGSPEKIYFFITHTHWDHILSFPFFKPLYDENCHIVFHAPVSHNEPFENLVQGQHNPRAFPVPYSQLKAQKTFIDSMPGDSYELEAAKATCIQLNHPGTTLGWRFETEEKIVAIVTDTAPIEDNYLGEGMAERAQADPKAFEAQYRKNLVAFIRNADLVVYDTHFTEEGIVNRHHWGHSTPEMAVEICLEADAKRLILHHHAPEDSDKIVHDKALHARKKVGKGKLQIEPGLEGMKIWL